MRKKEAEQEKAAMIKREIEEDKKEKKEKERIAGWRQEVQNNLVNYVNKYANKLSMKFGDKPLVFVPSEDNDENHCTATCTLKLNEDETLFNVSVLYIKDPNGENPDEIGWGVAVLTNKSLVQLDVLNQELEKEPKLEDLSFEKKNYGYYSYDGYEFIRTVYIENQFIDLCKHAGSVPVDGLDFSEIQSPVELCVAKKIVTINKLLCFPPFQEFVKLCK